MKSSKPLWYITVADKKTSKITKKYELVGPPLPKIEKDLKERALDYFKLEHNTDGYISTSMFVGYVASVKELPVIEKPKEPEIKFVNTNRHKLKYKKPK